jgi:hypothetical protein
MKIECCGNCKHYSEAYCNLIDDLVEPCDNCGMCDCGECKE